MAELINEQEEQEILNISDEGGENTDDEQELDGQDEQEDRGDEFVDPEAEGAEDDDGDGKEGDGKEDEDDDAKGGDEDDDDKHVGGVPFGRLNEVSRVKSAATAIADGIVDGLIDAQTIRDLGGANAVAKAVANKEITLDELKRFDAGTPGTQQGEDGKSNPSGPESTPWNLDDKYVEYQELVDAGETKEAAQLLRQINREERIRDRAEETAKQQQATLDVYVSQLMTEYPVLADVKSREHEEVMVWANHLQATQRITRQAALEKAVTRVFPNGKAAGSTPGNDGKASSETAQERAIRERKEAAIRRGAKASRQQPPPMDLGATPNGPAKFDPANMTEEEFEQLSESEKKKYRGDFV
jgi:hypothetical protein